VDLEEDRQLRAQTLPVRFGLGGSVGIIYFSLAGAWVMSLVMFWVFPGKLGLLYLAGAFLSGLYFLILPAHRLFRTRVPEEAANLFNRASYYPLAMVLVTIISWTF
jgi:4-hydroxybenzoate polyprenyltransferase